MRFELTGRLRGEAILLVDGEEVGRGPVDRTCPVSTGLEPLDCGQDTQTPVSTEYESPFRFTGRIDKVVLEVQGKEPRPDLAAEEAAALAQE
jgi:arylsulfatase